MTTHRYEYDVLVLGAGSAGVAAAETAISRGRRVAIVEPRLDIPLGHLPRATVVVGYGRFADAHTVLVSHEWGGLQQVVTAERIVIAVGSVPGALFPTGLERGSQVIEGDGEGDRIRTAVVIGAEEDGLERASALARVGVAVTVVERRSTVLPAWDREVVEALVHHLRRRAVAFRLGQEVAAIFHDETRSAAVLRSGARLVADRVLLLGGRDGATECLALDRAGLTADHRGRLRVDMLHRTRVRHIYAAGSVLGRPLGAPSSSAQGRLAGAAGSGRCIPLFEEVSVNKLRADPEVSFVGVTEEDMIADGAAYEVGRAPLIADGLLKVLVDLETRHVVGIHAVGPGAEQLVSAGRVLLSSDGVEEIIGAVANQPKLAPYLVAGRAISERLLRSGDCLAA